MAAGVYNFKVEQGVEYAFSVVYKNKEGVPIDLTGYSGYGNIKLKMSDTSPVASFVISIDPLIGKASVSLPFNALNNITFKGNKFNDYVEVVYDIILKKSNADPKPIRLLNGTIQVSPKVT